jgi:hypothetical protein
MLPIRLKVALLIAILIYFILILWFLKKKALELKYTLLWIAAGIIMAVLVFFPSIIQSFVSLVGITTVMNGLYVMCMGFIIILMVSLTSIVSRQSLKIRTLIQDNAMLEKRIRDLERQNEEKNNTPNDRLEEKISGR